MTVGGVELERRSRRQRVPHVLVGETDHVAVIGLVVGPPALQVGVTNHEILRQATDELDHVEMAEVLRVGSRRFAHVVYLQALEQDRADAVQGDRRPRRVMEVRTQHRDVAARPEHVELVRDRTSGGVPIDIGVHVVRVPVGQVLAHVVHASVGESEADKEDPARTLLEAQVSDDRDAMRRLGSQDQPAAEPAIRLRVRGSD